VVHDVDPELSFDVDALLPEDYVADVGVRLSFYKRLASARDEAEVEELANELQDRFGPPPLEARKFIELMRLKTELRKLRALGCEATARSVTLHLKDDTPLDPVKVGQLVAKKGSPYRLSPDGRLMRRALETEALADGLASPTACSTSSRAASRRTHERASRPSNARPTPELGQSGTSTERRCAHDCHDTCEGSFAGSAPQRRGRTPPVHAAAFDSGRTPSAMGAAQAGFELFHRLVDRERGGPLSGREILERLQELSQEPLRRGDQIRLPEMPVPVRVRGRVRALEGIGPQVEELGDSQRHE